MRDDRPQLVGIFPRDRSLTFNAGSILCAAGQVSGHGDGWITAVTHSPELGHWIGIGFIAGGQSAWEGKRVMSADPVREAQCRGRDCLSTHGGSRRRTIAWLNACLRFLGTTKEAISAKKERLA